MKKLMTLLLAGAMVLALAACGKDSAGQTDTKAADTKAAGTKTAETKAAGTETAGTKEAAGTEGKALKIGHVPCSLGSEVEVGTADSFTKACEERGWECITLNPDSSVEKQIANIEDLIAQDVDAICLKPLDTDACATALQTCKAAGVPVFVYFREASGEAGVDYVTCMNMDMIYEGRMCGEWVENEFGDADLKIAIITGTEGGSDVRDRRAGFKEVTDLHENWEIVSEQPANWSTSEAQKVMTNILQTTGGEIDVLYTHGDGMAVGAVAAIQQYGLKPGEDIKIVSINGESEALSLCADGKINFITGFNQMCGPDVIELVEKHFNGESLEGFYMVPEVSVTAENAAEVNKEFWGVE